MEQKSNLYIVGIVGVVAVVAIVVLVIGAASINYDTKYSTSAGVDDLGQAAARSAICTGPLNQSCKVINGVGTQSRTCNSRGVYSAWGKCIATSCNQGFIMKNGACVRGTPVCDQTCANQGFTCDTQTICGNKINCGICKQGYICSSGSCISISSCKIPTCTGAYDTGKRDSFNCIIYACPNAVNTTKCIDSDGGLNYNVTGKGAGLYSYNNLTGVIIGENKEKCSVRYDGAQSISIVYDCCVDSATNTELREANCKDGILVDSYYTCPNGCKNGACAGGLLIS